ncbi:MAG: ABC transporter ATP-binding protein [Bacillota bacterium]|nr:ABC transporter ATP-binding protein [Candidatus Fermentithermobacillaceae bacterium]
MLTVDNVSVFYGRICALDRVSISVNEGEIVSIIGPNGAGKSTLLWTIMGVMKPSSGSLWWRGERLQSVPSWVAARGISMVPERRRLFDNLTVRENLLIGAYLRQWDSSMKEDMETVFRLFPVLKERLNQYAGTLSGGEQQMLAIGRAMMGRPALLLFDEPSLGLAPALTSEVFRAIRRIREEGTTCLLAEQNAFKALEMADRAYVMNVGRVALQGSGKEVLANPEVRAAYLGVKAGSL